ncbi:FtsQ-type POTRA domain-containing protein [Microbacterium limosum]|uniref:FtsQ-type POTRA domain-containing protein n=1 Tax=Microbacterium limosum TaxID=3079935 RepID=A0AAU0MJM6_9MICO|nr:FtsQ-type POTRA domain-containing protein [Microbacterium sp. Y20]WOQ70469.1 FtsQ-type POTRA domain-containing protein [Microbacterium sp. Y20]
MRRPAPLPTPPRAQADAEADAAARALEGEHDAGTDATQAQASATEAPPATSPGSLDETAEVPWLRDRTREATDDRAATPAERAASALPFASVRRPAAVVDDEQTATGWRDVWRAARARRRALRREVRRFTARSRRRRVAWAVGVGAVVLLVVGSVGAAYSPLFAVERISVVGTETLPADALERALGAQLGRPLPLVDASEVKAALVGFPLVESYTLEARPPHDLVVRIVERTPIGVIQGRAGWTLVDAAGVALETTPDAPEGRPVLEVSGGTGSDAFDSVGLVMRALPDAIRAQVTRVSASTRDDVTLTLGATGTQIVWGSVDDTPMKARVLETAMGTRPPETVSTYDISSPEAIVIR